MLRASVMYEMKERTGDDRWPIIKELVNRCEMDGLTPRWSAENRQTTTVHVAFLSRRAMNIAGGLGTRLSSLPQATHSCCALHKAFVAVYLYTV